MIIYSHAGPNRIETASHTESGFSSRIFADTQDTNQKLLYLLPHHSQDMTIDQIAVSDLSEKKINTLVLIGCNTGLTEQDMGQTDLGKIENIATAFSQKEGIERGIAADGTVCHSYVNFTHHFQVIKSTYYHSDGMFDGFKIYYHGNEQNPYYIGKEFKSITDLINCEKE